MPFSRFKTLKSLMRTSPHKTQHFIHSPFMRSITCRPLLPLRRFSSTPSPLRNGEESKVVKITVWWDIENCAIPTGVDPYRVAHRITSAPRSHGIKGPLTITAFGNMLQFKQATIDALYCTGVVLNHVPNYGKNSADRSILANLVYWVTQNPPPAHFFLISGDKDFASILHRLRMSNYNILLASGSYGSTALYNAATIMWNWDALVRGDSLTGRLLNHPPNGLYGSWYGETGINDGKNSSYPVTPYPMKQPCKTVAKPRTLKLAGTAICKSYSKSFISPSALQSHTKAKHVGTIACKLCSKSFISKSALRSHTKAKHA